MENGDWQMHKSLVECNRVMLEKQVLILLGHILLPPATKLGQGYVFTGVCDSVHRGGLPQCMLGYPPEQTPLQSRHPPEADTPLPREQTPPDQTPPHRRACWEIRSTRGRYAPYWTAILLQEKSMLSSLYHFSTIYW